MQGLEPTGLCYKYFLQSFSYGQSYKTFFRRNYVAIGVTSVKIIGKYTASGVNYALKSFIITVVWLFEISF
jgi:hypothetical protein